MTWISHENVNGKQNGLVIHGTIINNEKHSNLCDSRKFAKKSTLLHSSQRWIPSKNHYSCALRKKTQKKLTLD